MSENVTKKKWPLWQKLLVGSVAVLALVALGAILYAVLLAQSVGGGIVRFFNWGVPTLPN